MYSPICLFTYNRLDLTKRTIEELGKNYLASQSILIIFSDGPKTPENNKQVIDLSKYLKTIEGFLSVEIHESSFNKGLADSIIAGVTEVVDKYGKAIVLEDDLLTTPNFLSYMNQALLYYESSK